MKDLLGNQDLEDPKDLWARREKMAAPACLDLLDHLVTGARPETSPRSLDPRVIRVPRELPETLVFPVKMEPRERGAVLVNKALQAFPASLGWMD